VDRSETIVKEVNAALERDPRISFHKHPLKIAVDPDGTLVLEGELENIAAKKLALEHAAAIGGVIGIVDRLRIAPSVSPTNDLQECWPGGCRAAAMSSMASK
jgi:osmotically-inducible protein OsmY